MRPRTHLERNTIIFFSKGFPDINATEKEYMKSFNISKIIKLSIDLFGGAIPIIDRINRKEVIKKKFFPELLPKNENIYRFDQIEYHFRDNAKEVEIKNKVTNDTLTITGTDSLQFNNTPVKKIDIIENSEDGKKTYTYNILHDIDVRNFDSNSYLKEFKIDFKNTETGAYYHHAFNFIRGLIVKENIIYEYSGYKKTIDYEEKDNIVTKKVNENGNIEELHFEINPNVYYETYENLNDKDRIRGGR